MIGLQSVLTATGCNNPQNVSVASLNGGFRLPSLALQTFIQALNGDVVTHRRPIDFCEPPLLHLQLRYRDCYP